MSFNQFSSNRNSTSDAASSNSTLRPPSSRLGMSSGHHLRASADMGALSAAAMSNRSIRPASEVYYNARPQSQSFTNQDEGMDNAAQQWIADIDQYENTLEEMAAATLDQDFKDELTAIEQWFRVLSEAERTAALYALLQQTTQVQTRFFIGVLQQMAKSHPVSGMISPSSFGERDVLSNRLSSAMGKLNVEGPRNSFGFGRLPPSPSTKRNSGLDPAEISSMFPDAAAAIAKQKADFTQHTGSMPTTSRNSTATISDRNSLITPTITTPLDDPKKDPFMQPPVSPWAPRVGDFQQIPARPKSSSSQRPQPMGQFSQPSGLPQIPSSGMASSPFRSPIPTAMHSDKNMTGSLGKEAPSPGMPMFSPFPPGASWASMSNTPMMSTFSTQQPTSQADIVANATAMKLAAMSTVNNRIQLDDVRKYRRTRSTEGQQRGVPGNSLPGMQSSALPSNFIMTNELGHVLSPHMAAALQAQQIAAMSGRRSRPASPGITMVSGGLGTAGYGPPSGNGYLSAFDSSNSLLGTGLGNLHLGQYGGGLGEGYMSDASEINRGRSPRGRRGSSKPPEDPTDLELLKDIPNWLRSLRLHKYTDNLKDMRWQDLIMLDDDGLERKGVNALGARRKMTKVFEQVREAQAMRRI